MKADIYKAICRFLYYNFAIYLPVSNKWGGVGKCVRYQLCKRIFKKCGTDVNIERGAKFGGGELIEIGDHSGIGINAVIPDGSIIGSYCMMGPNCFVHQRNHKFSRTDIPMMRQGFTERKPIIIEDDVWIGRDVTIMVGRHISKGSIIAANCVLTKDFPEYSVVGGNPSRLIRSRVVAKS